MGRRMRLNGRLVETNSTMRHYAQRARAEGKAARLWTSQMLRYEEGSEAAYHHARRAAHFGLEALKPMWAYDEWKAAGK